jgi:UDP-2,3-diacylglucosamine pyrophosphatase LpxH
MQTVSGPLLDHSRQPRPQAGLRRDGAGPGGQANGFYRSVFLSDTHLCSRDCQIDVLCDFLDSFKCDYLYLVGDIFDFWCLGKTLHWPNLYNHVITQVLKRATKGAKVCYIPGNHDEFLRGFAGMHFGEVAIVNDCIHEGLDGKRYWVLHGDVFDSVVQCHAWLSHLGDKAYTCLILLNRTVNAVRRWLGLPPISLSGAIKRRVKSAVNFVTRFEDVLATEARKREVDGVICGHIHQPMMRGIAEMAYMNTGDWIENCTALVEHTDGRFELIPWCAVMEDRRRHILPLTA